MSQNHTAMDGGFLYSNGLKIVFPHPDALLDLQSKDPDGIIKEGGDLRIQRFKNLKVRRFQRFPSLHPRGVKSLARKGQTFHSPRVDE
jgi:hypothetical protein